METEHEKRARQRAVWGVVTSARWVVVAVTMLAITFGGPSSAHAQVIELVTAGASVTSSALLGKAGKDIIMDARLAASGLLAERKRTGNALITRGADEMNVSVDNAIRMLDVSVDKKFETLEGHEQRTLLGVAQAAVAVKALAGRAYRTRCPVVRTPNKTVLIDTCVDNDKARENPNVPGSEGKTRATSEKGSYGAYALHAERDLVIVGPPRQPARRS